MICAHVRIVAALASILFAASAPARPVESVIYSDSADEQETGMGFGGLVSDSAGNLYGTDYQSEEVFELSPPSAGHASWTRTVLYTFKGVPDGYFPIGSLILDSAGNLYGMTDEGGSGHGGTCPNYPAGCGTVYRLSPPAVGATAWTETVLHSFHGSDGDTPTGGVIIDGNGNLYGVTQRGGGNADCDCGVVFKLSPPSTGATAWTETVLYKFHLTQGADPLMDGIEPYGALIRDSDGNLYGTADGGAAPSCPGAVGCGVVFRLSPPAPGKAAWTETVLHSFRGADGYGGDYSFLIADGSGGLYGAASYGGKTSADTCPPPGGCGTVFHISPPTTGRGSWTTTIIHYFTGAQDGAFPVGLLRDSSGVLYGPTVQGGSSDNGLIFKLTPPVAGTKWVQSNLYSFRKLPDAEIPSAGLAADPSGALYGSAFGGKSNNGAIYKLTGTGFAPQQRAH